MPTLKNPEVEVRRGGNLHAHHIKEWAKFPEFRYEVSNGMTVHEKSHRLLHARQRAERLVLLGTCTERIEALEGFDVTVYR